MTQEEKQVLLKDLSARLPCGVIVQYKGHNTIIKNKVLTGSDLDCNMEYYKPYLRPMSSMTEQELEELNCLCYHHISVQDDVLCGQICYIEITDVQDFLLRYHFDFMDLIPKGLAIEVTEENNPYK